MTTLGMRKLGEWTAEKRSWLWGPHGTEPGANPGVTYDGSLFETDAQVPEGYIPSGILVGKVTATGLYGPYDATATDGRQTAIGHNYSTLPIPTGTDKRVAGALFVHGFIRPSKLPIETGPGALDAAARTALTLIHYLD